jgi:peroxiredoxin
MQRMISALALAIFATVVVGACQRPIAEPISQPAAAGIGVQAAERASAQDDSPPTPEQILHRMADFYKGLQGFQVKIHRTMHAELQGHVEDLSEQMTLAIQRPNRLAWHVENEGQGIDVVSDGTNLTIHSAELKRYTQEKAPASFQEESFQELSNHPLFGDATGDGIFFLKLLADDPYAAVTQGVGSVSYAGKETVGGKPSWHLKLAQEAFDWDLWIAADGQPVVVRVSHDLTKKLAADGVQADGARLTSTQDFTEWQWSVQPSADTFAFSPPAGSSKVDSFAPEEPEAAAMALVGKPAPKITANLLGGGDFSLADQHRHGIVMLDFWATTCGPCAKEMPVLAEVAAQYKDKGVKLYAVNQGESEKMVTAFLQQAKLDVPVVLDPDMNIGVAYQMEALPMLVLVDTRGIVQSVHVGSRPDLAERLKGELDGLLAGKDLAAEYLKAHKAQAAKPTEGER